MSFFTVTPAEARRFNNAFKAAIEQKRREVAEVYRGYTIAIFQFLLRETPQWTGSAVSNWNYSLGSPSDFTQEYYQKIFKGGDPPYDKLSPNKAAVRAAQAKANNVISGADYTTFPTAYMTNAAKDLNGQSYIQMLEENSDRYLRRVNDPGMMVKRATTQVNGYLAIITPQAMHALRSLRVNYDVGFLS